MKQIRIGEIYDRDFLEEYIIKHESSFIELNGDPCFSSSVPYQKFKVLEIYDNVRLYNREIDMDRFKETRCEKYILSDQYRNKIIIVEKVKK